MRGWECHCHLNAQGHALRHATTITTDSSEPCTVCGLECHIYLAKAATSTHKIFPPPLPPSQTHIHTHTCDTCNIMFMVTATVSNPSPVTHTHTHTRKHIQLTPQMHLFLVEVFQLLMMRLLSTRDTSSCKICFTSKRNSMIAVRRRGSEGLQRWWWGADWWDTDTDRQTYRQTQQQLARRGSGWLTHYQQTTHTFLIDGWWLIFYTFYRRYKVHFPLLFLCWISGCVTRIISVIHTR